VPRRTAIAWPAWGSEPPDDAEVVSWQGHHGPVLTRHGDATVLRCSPCLGIHVVPLPDDDTLRLYYQHEFYQRDKPQYVQQYERDRLWWEFTHRKILERALERLPAMPPDDVRCLDIGAGPGLALDAAAALGLETWGIEVNPTLAGRLEARGHAMLCGTLDTAGRYPEPLPMRPHLCYLYEVLEHLPWPAAALLQCWELLAEGGLVVVQVPNDFNPQQLEACATLDLPYWFVHPPQHLHYFNPTTLRCLLQRCGFDVVYARSTYPMEQFLLDGKNYVRKPALGRWCHIRRMRAELLDETTGKWPDREAEYARQLAADGIGRELLYIGRKR